MVGKPGQKSLVKSEFGEITSVQKYTQLFLTQQILWCDGLL
jgi:hypothetical protein